MFSGTNAEYIKTYNRSIVLEAIRRDGPLSRADLARSTGLSHQAVSNIVGELEHEGLVRRSGRRTGGRGQPPVELEIEGGGAYAVGLDLNRDHLAAALVDLAGTTVERRHLELDTPPPDAALELMREVVADLIAAAPRDALRGVGVALPGQIQASEETVTIPTNFPGWRDVPVEARLAELTGLPVWVENDAVAAAVGERWFGTGRDLRDALYLYFGIGIGGGWILGRQPYRGESYNAGKVGHIPVEWEGRPCSCGSRGCLERYASIGALSERIHGEGGPPLHPSGIAELHARGDARLAAWYDEAARALAQGILTLENLFDPQAVLLGGRLPPEVAAELLARTEAHLAPRRMRGKPHVPELGLAALAEHAAALGAATLPLHATLTPSHGLLLKQAGARAEGGGASDRPTRP